MTKFRVGENIKLFSIMLSKKYIDKKNYAFKLLILIYLLW